MAGGVESMSRVAMGADGGGQDGDNLHLRERVFQVPQGISADLIATLENISRDEVDAWALRSQRYAARAMEEGRFDKSLFAVSDPKSGNVALERDEFPRADTTAEGLRPSRQPSWSWGKQPPAPTGETLDQLALKAYPQAKAIQHVHTAGNSSGIVDGAAAVALASEKYVREKGIKPRARIRATTTVGSEPVIMLTAPAGPRQRESFAHGWHEGGATSIYGRSTRRSPRWYFRPFCALGIDPERVNVNGRVNRPRASFWGRRAPCFWELRSTNSSGSGKATALVTMCIGGGKR